MCVCTAHKDTMRLTNDTQSGFVDFDPVNFGYIKQRIFFVELIIILIVIDNIFTANCSGTCTALFKPTFIPLVDVRAFR